MVNIYVNDESVPLPQAMALQEFLASWQSKSDDNSPTAFAVAINGEFVPRALYAEVILKAGDTLDIVSPVGGG